MAKISRELSAWRSMIRRCTEPKQACFNKYGGAGIRVCREWMEGYGQFLLDMGPAPTPDSWLGRLDVFGNYDPANCIWTNRTDQMNRRSNCRKVEYRGQVMTSAQAAKAHGGMNRKLLLKRASLGHPLEIPLSKLYERSIWLTWDGKTLPIPEWSRITGIPRSVLSNRVNLGWPVEQVLNPARDPNRNLRSLLSATSAVLAAKARQTANR